ncbi:adhesion G-protein coupled receptor G4-like [Kryptolebias marmoratus]|uniref:adhesion G-protein coupled receptor G4-like n=1 Tax=Kryptolebias marmoratus TaxID=37003 RepID=UPI0018ACCF09|nr:adhesion G-protein coupled receptor G4-like [Kryptolebias marmoratus]
MNPLRCELAPNGSLTLGAGHTLKDGSIQIIPYSRFLGKLSLFRIWGRERSKQEVTSLNCTEGDLVKWERKYWDSSYCDPLPDTSLQCEWSIYEIKLLFAIIRSDVNHTELYTARDIAHSWVKHTKCDFMNSNLT